MLDIYSLFTQKYNQKKLENNQQRQRIELKHSNRMRSIENVPKTIWKLSNPFCKRKDICLVSLPEANVHQKRKLVSLK